MKTFKLLFLIVALISVSISSATSDVFNSKLSAKEREQLENGQVIIRNLDSYKDICVSTTPETEKIVKAISNFKPAYIAEVIQIRPYKGNENLQDKLNLTLLKLSDYTDIPYYSERTKKTYKLYSKAELKDAIVNGRNTTIYADMNMSVFGDFKARIDIEEAETFYFYSMRNLDKLRYHDKFTAINKENMRSYITLFRDGDNWILYSIGCADAIKIFFMEERVETSFINRIKTFSNYIFQKL